MFWLKKKPHSYIFIGSLFAKKKLCYYSYHLGYICACDGARHEKESL